MTERYLPVPMWNNSKRCWEPVDFRNGQKIVSWPEGFNPDRLPFPEYCDGDRVQFVRDETCAREGTVRMVLLRGGVYGPLDNIENLLKQWYCNPDNITYIVTARGHNHMLRGWNIIGRFVSLDRDRF